MNTPKLYTYIMTVDSGLAPTPFWGYCTLAVCTPNPQGCRAKAGDYIAGFTTKREGYRLIYMMQVCEKLRMDKYFTDPRFQEKKPQPNKTWQEKCGDNLYQEISPNKWITGYNPYHHDNLEQDTKNPFVFVGEKFWYFGENCIDVPEEFASLSGGMGTRVNHDENIKNNFINWVVQNHAPGCHGLPRDRADKSCHTAATCQGKAPSPPPSCSSR